jgi:hypothetical protein
VIARGLRRPPTSNRSVTDPDGKLLPGATRQRYKGCWASAAPSP